MDVYIDTNNPCCFCKTTRTRVLLDTCNDFEYGIIYNARLVYCMGCGIARLDPLPQLEDIHHFYPPEYANYSNSGSELTQFLVDLYERKIQNQALSLVPQGGKVLDVGCGGGQYLDKLVGLGLELYGSEFSDDAALKARCKGYTIYAGELHKLDLPSKHFDLIRLNHVIEHVINPVLTLESAARILRPGGTVLVDTPNLDCIDFKILRRYWGALHFPRHIHLFTPRTLEAIARINSLDIRSIKQTIMPTGWSLGVQNWIVDKFKVHLNNGRCKIYPLLMVSFVPLVAIQRLFGVATMMQVELTNLPINKGQAD